MPYKTRMALVFKERAHRVENHPGRFTFLDMVRKTCTHFPVNFLH